MIDEYLRVHDAFELEIRQRLPFSPDGSASSYSSETYLFVPTALNINRDTFPKSHFYRSLKNYIRLQVPSMRLPLLMGPGSMLEALCADFKTLPVPYDNDGLSPEQKKAVLRHESDTKIFCLSLQRAVREGTLEVERTKNRQEADERSVVLARTARAILDAVWRLGDGSGGELPVHIPAAQEFCSDVFSYHALRLLRFFDKADDAENGQQARGALRELIRIGSERRGAISPDATPRLEGDNIAFVARWNMLKKYISTPLFLDIHRKREGVLIQHIAYGIAAALAMIFATGIAFIWQIQYGAVSGPLFVALVISYIFKDRLKDLLRDYMTSAFSRHMSDRKLTIYRHNASYGSCKELFEFLEPKHLPSDVRAVRELTADELPFALRQEEILYYRKNILVQSGSGAERETGGLLDITRLNLWEFSRNMDGDREELLLFDDGRARRASGVKTYPLFIIRRHTHGGVRVCTASRLIMGSRGVMGIERLYPAGGLAEDPEDLSLSAC